MKPGREPYRTETIPRMRRFSLDAGALGRRKHIVHGLIEVDISEVRRSFRSHEERTTEKLSLTAYIIYCLSRSISQNPHLHAYRDWRSRLVIYEHVNITSMVEIESEGRKIPIPHLFQAVNRKSYREVHDELRAVQQNPQQTRESDFMGWFLYLPSFARRLFYWIVLRIPSLARTVSSSVMVTAVGMFGRGGGWGITMPNFTLTVTVGGIVEKPGVVAGRIEIREYLDLTISVDHDIVDGAPMARFVAHLRESIERGEGLA